MFHWPVLEGQEMNAAPRSALAVRPHGARLRRAVRCVSVLLATGPLLGDPALALAQTFGGVPAPVPACATPKDRQRIAADVSEARRSFAPPVAAAALPEKFTFHPLGGSLYRDLYTMNFVDLAPSAGLLDWDCTDFTYDGHDASDVMLRSFGEQDIGVPVFAALDGTVVATHDGEPDKNRSCTGVANYVVIDHAGGRQTQYLHLRRNSVQVAVGEVVRAGDQLGLAASSGCSTYPHLHFATYDDATVVEPYAGPCRPGASEWLAQTPIERTLYMGDLNITDVDIASYPGLPVDMPRTGTFITGTRAVYFWTILNNLPASSSIRARYRRPDSTIALDTGSLSLGNSFYRWSWWWLGRLVNLDQPGTWQLLVEVNGNELVEAPFEVVASTGEVTNRAPSPVALTLEPDAPDEADVLVCRVNGDLVLDDPDYDIVRYTYEWTVDGTPVRSVVSAARSDALPHHTGSNGQVVGCRVTPSDGTASGSPVQVVRVLGAAQVPSLGPKGLALLTLLLGAAGVAVRRVAREPLR